MKKLRYVFALLCVFALLMQGCASTGLTAASQLTNVQLGSPNFRIVATNVSGEASVRGVLGFSFGFGMAASQVVLIPLENDRTLYRNAMTNLWENFEAANAAPINRKLALVNVRYDSEALNTFVFTKISAVVVADVVEFQ